MADVFICPVYIKKTPEAACLGAAYRAKYVVYMEYSKKAGDQYCNYHDYIKQFCDKDSKRIVEPYCDSDEIYIPMLERYRDMVRIMMERQNWNVAILIQNFEFHFYLKRIYVQRGSA